MSRVSPEVVYSVTDHAKSVRLVAPVDQLRDIRADVQLQLLENGLHLVISERPHIGCLTAGLDLERLLVDGLHS